MIFDELAILLKDYDIERLCLNPKGNICRGTPCSVYRCWAKIRQNKTGKQKIEANCNWTIKKIKEKHGIL